MWDDVYTVIVDYMSILAKGGVNINSLKSYVGDLKQGKTLAHEELVHQ